MGRKITTGVRQVLAEPAAVRVKTFATDNALLQARIAQLEELLHSAKANSAIQKVPLSQIRVNPKQPRKSFYVVQEKIETLRKDGQKTPIILTRPPGVEWAMIFDGECRLKAAIELGWETIDAIFIPYSESFQTDVLISSIQDKGLNNLDLAEALVEEVRRKLPQLKQLDVVKILNTALIRLRRQGLYPVFKNIHLEDFEQQQELLSKYDLKPEELVIFSTILTFRLNLLTVSTIKFPYLKLVSDVKRAIREQGLGDAQAIAINKIVPTNKRLSLSADKAKKLRSMAIAQVISRRLTPKETSKYLEELTSPYILKSVQEEAGKKYLSSWQAKINSINTNNLNKAQKEQLVATLGKKIAEIKLEQHESID